MTLKCIVYLLFGKGRADGKRRSSGDNRASFMENLFTTGDFQKDMQTLKNTLLNTKISHIEHVPKSKETADGKFNIYILYSQKKLWGFYIWEYVYI